MSDVYVPVNTFSINFNTFSGSYDAVVFDTSSISEIVLTVYSAITPGWIDYPQVAITGSSAASGSGTPAAPLSISSVAGGSYSANNGVVVLPNAASEEHVTATFRDLPRFVRFEFSTGTVHTNYGSVSLYFTWR